MNKFNESIDRAPPQDYFVQAAYGEYEAPWEIPMSQPVIVQKLTEDLVFGSLPHTGKQTVGDICCGVGHHSVLFALQGFHVTGIDINAIAIQRAQKNKLKAQAAIEAAGGSLAFICGNVLEDRDISATVGKFNILIDSAAYHCFSPVKKSSYVRFLTSLSHMGTRLLFLNLRITDETTGSGPQTCSREEVNETFTQSDWQVDVLEDSVYHHFPMVGEGGPALYALLSYKSKN